ncbi:MAG: DivIVA domain-containing protein [Acidimicrobiia bacterium]
MHNHDRTRMVRALGHSGPLLARMGSGGDRGRRIGKVEIMISASAADAHRFGHVKKNGYDPVEVDAVVARLVETLKGLETKNESLEERLAEADASADAIRRTFIAAEATRDEIVGDARTEAHDIVETARGDADQLIDSTQSQAQEILAEAESESSRVTEMANQLETEVAEQRDAILSEAHEQAESVLAEAETAAAARELAAAEEAEAVINEVQSDFEGQRREIAMVAQTTAVASAWTRKEATMQADQIVRDAEERAAAVVRSAEEYDQEQRDRVATLRSAIEDLEASAKNLASITEQEVSVVDLSEIESIETEQLVDPEPRQPDRLSLADERPEPVDHEERETLVPVAEPVDLHDEIEEEPESRKPLLTVAEAAAEIEYEDESDDPVEAEKPEDQDLIVDEAPPATTYYQRTTGTPLSERVKIARKSG